MRSFLVIFSSLLVAALIVGTIAGILATMIFYDGLFQPGHTDHERGIAWFLVVASSIVSAMIVVIGGAIYWIITVSHRALMGNNTNLSKSES